MFDRAGVATSLEGHTRNVFGVAWIRNGKRLAMGRGIPFSPSADNTENVWDEVKQPDNPPTVVRI